MPDRDVGDQQLTTPSDLSAAAGSREANIRPSQTIRNHPNPKAAIIHICRYQMDFKELPVDGQALEQLVRELLFSLGLHVEWSGRGPDGGRDLLCRETLVGNFLPQDRTWLVQCKHKAHGGDSVSVNDLDDIVSSCIQHNANGYILVCSTQPSSAVVNRLEGITKNQANSISATYWDSVTLQRLLSQPRQWAIAQRFMPKSCGEWQIYATEAPNDFVAHYKGYVFHLSNRIGSKFGHHLPSLEARISDMESLALPKGHFIRPRAVWHDDKNGGYRWYIDYMRPHNQNQSITKYELLQKLKDGWALEDGQLYTWDINYVIYNGFSDHYDEDHYDYYTRYLPNYLGGSPRTEDSDREEYWSTKQEIADFEANNRNIAMESFDAMEAAFRRLPYLRVLRAVNCKPEALPRFVRRYDWSDLITEFDVDTDNILTATMILDVFDVDKFFDLLKRIKIDGNGYFRVGRVYVFLPDTGLDTEADENIFDLHLKIHPDMMTNQRATRNEYNSYFKEIKATIDQQISSFT